ncbi:unnamed protein product, partial [marine sediment metagenome]
MEVYLDKGIKEVITEFPEIEQILDLLLRIEILTHLKDIPFQVYEYKLYKL